MNEDQKANQVPLAIIGIGCLFPKAASLREFWSNIKAKVDAITEIPPSHWAPEDYFEKDPKKPDMTYARRGGFLKPVDFDPAEFGITPATLEATDSAQLLGLVAAQMALKDAGYGPGKEFDRDKVSVILGVTGTLELVVPLGARLGHPVWRKALKEHGLSDAEADSIVERIKDGYVPWQESSFPGLLGNVVAGRIANRFNLGGTNCVVDAACASSLGATHLASLELAARRSSMVVTGGVDCFNDIFMFMCFSKTPALSPTGDAKPFDKKADGTILGEGLGMVVLKRLDDAERDGDKIYAVVKGVGSSSDGRGKSIYAPSAEGQAKALKKAYELAGVSPATVELVEAHGTGTSAGDAAEISALKDVYAASGRDGRWCALGSVKSMIGHTKAAAGSAGMIKAALSLYHKVLPPTIKVTELNPAVEGGSFYVNTEKRPWLSSKHPRRAALSALGFGGSNFHVVLEEHRPKKSEIDWDGRVQLFAFSGDVRAAVSAFNVPASWEEAAVSAAGTRAAFKASDSQRLLIVAERGADLKKLFASALSGLSANAGKASWSLPDGVYFGSGAPVKVAALFAGQGSQYVGMGRDLFCQFPQAAEALEGANESFAGARRLSDLMDPSPAFSEAEKAEQEKALRSTDVAQPALGAAGLAMHRVLERFGFAADAYAGHSYGELAALCAAGRIDEAALHALSGARGKLMAAGDGGRGGMLAVQASAVDAQSILVAENLDLVVANKNAPRQSVLSGRKEEIARAAEVFEKRGVRAIPLPVSAAFHSPLVAGAARPFGEALDEISFARGAAPVYANKTAEAYPGDERACRALLASQLASPVEWVRLVENLYASGARAFVELGPGARLTGLVGGILAGRDFTALAVDASGGKRSGIVDLARALAQLAALGRPLKLELWEGGEAAALAQLPKKGKMSVKLSGANYRSSKPQATPIVKARPNADWGGSLPLAEPPRSSSTPANVSINAAVLAAQESLNALQRLQEQTAQLHLKFLESQEAAQRQFQALVDQQQRLFGAMLSGAPAHAMPVMPTAPVPSVQLAPGRVEVPAPAPAPAAPSTSVEKVLLAVVSEKTGYPIETLNPTMDLESDLGIDSIKRVEIMSCIQEKLPGAPKVKPEHLGTLRTLKAIVDFLSAGVAPSQLSPEIVENRAQAPSADVEKVLLAVVSEKTGYPVETLNPTMDLESDLGIDSIKRVEIMSCIQEKLPGAPKVKPEHLGTLRTLKSIVDFLSSAPQPAGAPPMIANTNPEGDQGRELPLAVKRYVVKAAEFDEKRAALALAKRPLLVAGEDPAFMKALAQRLVERGVDARVALPHAPAPEAASGLVVVSSAGRLAPAALWSERSEDELVSSLLLARKYEKALRAGAREGGALFATVTRLDGQFGLSGLRGEQDPVAGALAGLSKTASKEWTDVRCRALDLEAGWESAAAAAAEELLLEGPLELGLSASGARIPRLEELPAPDAAGAPLSDGDLVVVTGGARGVTVEAAAALAAQAKIVLALLGRSPAPSDEEPALASCKTEAELKKALSLLDPRRTPREIGERCRGVLAAREIRATLSRLQESGARAIYVQADLREPAALEKALAPLVKAHGPVRGLVHGAGVLADKLIADKTEEQARAVLGTKVSGLRHLLSVLDLSTLKAAVFFSSTTARFGRSGQSDYALANEALNKTAQLLAHRLGACRVVSIGWGPWDGGMVDASLKRLFAAEGVGVIPKDDGGRFFVDEISGRCRNAEVLCLAELEREPKAPQAALETAFEREVSIDNHPILRSHVINGKAVVPLALMVEWLAHAALHGNPGLSFAGLSDLRVLKGVLLEEGASCTVTALAGKAARGKDGFRVPVALRGAGGVVHASAEALLTSKRVAGPAAAPEPALKAYGRSLERAYAEVLFHGPELRAIRRVLGASEHGISCEAAAALPPEHWSRRPLRARWLADPAALDAAFQAMILWTEQHAGAPCLPAFVKEYRQYRDAFPEGGVVVRARVTKAVEGRAVADVDFVDERGALVARLEGLEAAVDGSLAASFRRNELIAR